MTSEVSIDRAANLASERGESSEDGLLLAFSLDLKTGLIWVSWTNEICYVQTYIP